MAIAEALLPEFEHEMATTRRVLERVSAPHASWRPHPKSWTMGELALHVARVPSWTALTLRETLFDLNPPGGLPQQKGFESSAALLETLDNNVAQARDAIRTTNDAAFMVPWSLASAGKVVFTMPRIAVMRSFVISHLIHHRGQLSVYLRLRDIPVPSIYGPTADEQPF